MIDVNPRRDKTLAEELRTEARRLKNLGFQLAEQVRYNERTAGERVNGRLKDEFGGRHVRVRGARESDVPLHVRRARTHRRPARTPGDITSAPPGTPSAPDRRQSPTGVPTLGRQHVETALLPPLGVPPVLQSRHPVGNPG